MSGWVNLGLESIALCVFFFFRAGINGGRSWGSFGRGSLANFCIVLVYSLLVASLIIVGTFFAAVKVALRNG